MVSCVLSLPQWRCYRNFEPLVSHTNVHAGYGRSWRAFLKRFLFETILTTMHTLRPSILAYCTSCYVPELLSSVFTCLFFFLSSDPDRPAPDAAAVPCGRRRQPPPAALPAARARPRQQRQRAAKECRASADPWERASAAAC